jgi:hypothetical protein
MESRPGPVMTEAEFGAWHEAETMALKYALGLNAKRLDHRS